MTTNVFIKDTSKTTSSTNAGTSLSINSTPIHCVSCLTATSTAVESIPASTTILDSITNINNECNVNNICFNKNCLFHTPLSSSADTTTLEESILAKSPITSLGKL